VHFPSVIVETVGDGTDEVNFEPSSLARTDGVNAIDTAARSPPSAISNLLPSLL